MKATVVDLRYKMKEVLTALDRREKVIILYHGKVKGTIIPAGATTTIDVEEHPFFNMTGKRKSAVARRMEELRGSRFNDF